MRLVVEDYLRNMAVDRSNLAILVLPRERRDRLPVSAICLYIQVLRILVEHNLATLRIAATIVLLSLEYQLLLTYCSRCRSSGRLFGF